MKYYGAFHVRVFLCCIAGILCAEIRAQDALPVSHGTILLQYVKGIEGKTPEGRRQFVKSELEKIGVRYTTTPFDTVLMRGDEKDTIYGENIVATVGSGKRKIVIGAHYDAVPRAPGANDNGSGVAIVLGMMRDLKERTFNHTIDFCFFDQEEPGLIGSAFYVKRYDTSYHHLAMINLDVEGTGDEIYVGPVDSSNSLLMNYIHKTRDSLHVVYEENKVYPGSDHESFAAANLENISISVVVKGDVEKLVKWVTSGFKRIEKKEDIPEVLRVMHTPNDKSDYITPEALALSYDFTKTALLLLDAGEP